MLLSPRLSCPESLNAKMGLCVRDIWRPEEASRSTSALKSCCLRNPVACLAPLRPGSCHERSAALPLESSRDCAHGLAIIPHPVGHLTRAHHLLGRGRQCVPTTPGADSDVCVARSKQGAGPLSTGGCIGRARSGEGVEAGRDACRGATARGFSWGGAICVPSGHAFSDRSHGVIALKRPRNHTVIWSSQHLLQRRYCSRQIEF
mmetsp:Transcript_51038/g.153406  ORF Transcript_51038/g.153406 Transcript_51038/m.153406 type:complete len:204 (+) Transcript_51038:720-1331(+)